LCCGISDAHGTVDGVYRLIDQSGSPDVFLTTTTWNIVLRVACVIRSLHFAAQASGDESRPAIRVCASLTSAARSWHAAVGPSPEVPLHCLDLVSFESSTVCAGPLSQVAKVTDSVPLTSLRRVDSARLL
jgi:hypothetical protein